MSDIERYTKYMDSTQFKTSVLKKARKNILPMVGIPLLAGAGLFLEFPDYMVNMPATGWEGIGLLTVGAAGWLWHISKKIKSANNWDEVQKISDNINQKFRLPALAYIVPCVLILMGGPELSKHNILNLDNGVLVNNYSKNESTGALTEQKYQKETDFVHLAINKIISNNTDDLLQDALFSIPTNSLKVTIFPSVSINILNSSSDGSKILQYTTPFKYEFTDEKLGERFKDKLTGEEVGIKFNYKLKNEQLGKITQNAIAIITLSVNSKEMKIIDKKLSIVSQEPSI